MSRKKLYLVSYGRYASTLAPPSSSPCQYYIHLSHLSSQREVFSSSLSSYILRKPLAGSCPQELIKFLKSCFYCGLSAGAVTLELRGLQMLNDITLKGAFAASNLLESKL